MELLDLPDEILSKILSFLTYDNLLEICKLSNDTHKLCKDEPLWRSLTLKEFGHVKIKGTWYNTFKEYYEKGKLSEEQKEILFKVKSSKQWNLLPLLKNYKTYKLGDGTRLSLNNIIFGIEENKTIKGVDKSVTMSTLVNGDQYELKLRNNELIATNYLLTDQKYIKEAENKGHSIDKFDKWTTVYFVYLTREQIDHSLEKFYRENI